MAAVRITPPSSVSGKDDLFAPSDTLPITFGALAGAQLTVKGVPEKSSGLKLIAQVLYDPTGRAVDLKTEVKLVPAGNGFTLTGTLPISGTWRLVISALPGSTGKMSYSLKIKQPKGVVFDADTIPAK